MRRGRVLAVVGATAVGKSALAVELAQRSTAFGRPAEIVNADSMQLYRGLDIGTAKATADERGGIVHHLIDVLELGDAASVPMVRDLARDVIDDCVERGVRPIVVGGSALYVHAILDDLEFQPTDPQIRARIAAEADRQGAAAMYERLRSVDPAAAAAILPGNLRRIVRALEVNEVTGSPFVARLPKPVYAYPEATQVGVSLDREHLAARIEQRVHQMWADGLVDEVRGLVERGLRDAPTASRALGYAQAVAYLDGRCTADEAIAATVIATRQFAKRQLTWFRRDRRIHWVAGDAADRVDRAWDVATAAYRDPGPAGAGDRHDDGEVG